MLFLILVLVQLYQYLTNRHFLKYIIITIKESPNWLTSGSPGMIHVYTQDGVRVKASNKRIVVESLSAETMNNLRELEPMLLATGSEKWENGKSRSIYGCDFVSYFVISHVLRHLEGKLNDLDSCDYGQTTWDQLRCILDKADYSGTSRDNFMMDFRNFNRQHSLLAQSMIWRSISESIAISQICRKAWNSSNNFFRILGSFRTTFPKKQYSKF